MYGRSGGSGSSQPAIYLQTALVRAQAVLDNTITKCLGTDFDNDQWYSPAVANGGTVVISQTATGGLAVLATTTTINGSAFIRPHGPPAYIGSVNTEKWYLRSRAKITTTPDANTIAPMLDLLPVSTTVPAVQVGITGASASFYSARIFNNGGTNTASVTSSVAVDTAYHTFEEWSDASSTVTFAVDGTIIGTATNANLGTGAVTLGTGVANTSTAGAQSITVDDIELCLVGP
jgi:hypothetical protein